MSWRQIIKAIEADARRQQRATASAERESMRQHRELQRREAEIAKYSEQVRARHDFDRFTNYLDLLVSVHKDCGMVWDWHAIAREEPPAHPLRTGHHEGVAQKALSDYKPGFLQKLFGGDKKQITALKRSVVQAHQTDDAEYLQAVQRHQQAYTAWNMRKTQAEHILARDVRAYPTVLHMVGALNELSAFQIQVALTATEPDAIAFSCHITDDQMVPRDELKLSAAGKLSEKPIPTGRYWELYQDHVCSAAIRVARETFAVLPLSRVLVNIGPVRMNTSTGHLEAITYLAVHFTRDALGRINLANIDPSDSMKNFHHRMKFKKTTGFEPVEPITLDENWIST